MNRNNTLPSLSAFQAISNAFALSELVTRADSNAYLRAISNCWLLMSSDRR